MVLGRNNDAAPTAVLLAIAKSFEHELITRSIVTKSASPLTGPSQIKIIFCTFLWVNEKPTHPKFYVATTFMG
jgi:hypothetical protein